MIKAVKQLQASLERQLGCMNSTASGAWNATCTLEDAQFDRTHPFRLLIPITEAVMEIPFVGDAEHHNHVTQELIIRHPHRRTIKEAICNVEDLTVIIPAFYQHEAMLKIASERRDDIPPWIGNVQNTRNNFGFHFKESAGYIRFHREMGHWYLTTEPYWLHTNHIASYPMVTAIVSQQCLAEKVVRDLVAFNHKPAPLQAEPIVEASVFDPFDL